MPETIEELTRFFEANGYVKLERVLSDDELADLREAADREIEAASGIIVMEEGTPMAVPRRLSKIIQRGEIFRKAAMHPAVAGFLFALLGSPVEVCLNRHNMMMVKSAYHGGQVDWHQDAGNWRCGKLISLMIMLDDATLDNGCIQLIPGIHHHPDFQHADPLLDLTIEKNRDMIRNSVPIECKAGEGFLFHSLTPHYSGPNKSPKFRRSLNFAYVASRDRHLAAEPYELESLTLEA